RWFVSPLCRGLNISQDVNIELRRCRKDDTHYSLKINNININNNNNNNNNNHPNQLWSHPPRMDCTRKKRPTRQKDFSAIAVPSMSGMGYLEYTIESHASRALNAMDEFRRDEMLCDLVLHVTQKERTVDFKVHKLVLASCSPYFRAMFTSSFKEGRASEVTLRDVCPLVVGKLIDFAYTARITVGDKCVLHILLGAMRYQMDDVAKACCDFLVKHLEPANVIGIARFAEGIGCTDLHQHSREYINTHFNEVGGWSVFIP
ncbi:hypothetical protein CRUP_036579, partial [Coryphaenoides rupestris]